MTNITKIYRRGEHLPKQCTRCGEIDDRPDNPLLCWGYVRSGITFGWVHKDCAEPMRKRQIEVLGAVPGDWEIWWLH